MVVVRSMTSHRRSDRRTLNYQLVQEGLKADYKLVKLVQFIRTVQERRGEERPCYFSLEIKSEIFPAVPVATKAVSEINM